jgi:hypothetical protein
LVLFEQKSKYEQDSIIMQWVIYRLKITGPNGRWMDGYHVPFDGSCFDGKEWLTDQILLPLLVRPGFAISDGTW